jgi:transitional endoplasmic reticulum ATPase
LELYLTAMQCYLRDVGKKVARIDSETLAKLEIREGEKLEIIRSRPVRLTCQRVYANDEGRKIIRLDAEDCHEAGASFGDNVLVRKVS